MLKKKILYICGSMNQTTQMHKISLELSEHEAYFTPFFATGFLEFLNSLKLVEFTILGETFKRNTLKYLIENNLNIDYRGENDNYDLVITSQDITVPSNIKKFKTILVQEGMTDPPDWRYHVTRFLHLYRWCASTSMTGLSHQYDYFCVASEGFRKQFIQRGINPNKIRVTGIPNFDNLNEMRELKFEHKNFVLVATSDIRETLKYENRKKLIKFADKIADGRKLIFKLHPNENVKKRIAEIKKYAPDALVYHGVSIDPLLANCDVFITKFSSTIFPALVLGKEVHCAFANEELNKLVPIQNDGTSAKNIAEVANELLESYRSIVRVKEKDKYYSDLGNNLKYLLKRKVARTHTGH
jgi:CDP-Glycerol:Poly(glycerophosphate) glycerophosphotransferase